MQELMKDQVCSVRRALVKSCMAVVRSMERDGQTASYFVKLIQDLATGKFDRRQLYAHICVQFLQDKMPAEEFEASYLVKLLALVDDKVANVRLLVAAAIKLLAVDFASMYDKSTHWEEIKAAYDKLCVDKDADVVFEAHGTLPERLQNYMKDK